MSFSGHASEMAYRADIDGLRAVAVLSVILFHANASWMPGGFIGVDIFFVISGFLITGVIAKAHQTGSFSYAEFYRRRIKRLFPVLFTVIGATLLAGQFILNEPDNQRMALSALASIFFAANVFFTFGLDTDYFADSAALEPLLHLWSLGVEEQFYIVWPAILGIAGAVWLTRRVGIVAIIIAAMASFALAQTLLGEHPMFAYYMLPARAGELLLGALAYALTERGVADKLGRAGREILSWTGVLAIGWSLIALNAESLFPGFAALPATAGTAAIIVAGASRPTTLGRLLAWRPVVWIGLLSYSLYLWHWPILAYSRYMFGDLLLAHQLVAIALTFGLSAASYYFIETPVRHSRASFSRLFTVHFAAPALMIALVVGVVVMTGGYAWRYFDAGYRASVASYEGAAEPASRLAYVCQRPNLTPNDLLNPACTVNTDDEPLVLVWGDSHAGHYVPALGVLAERYGFAFRNAAHSACPPFANEARVFARQARLDECVNSARMMTEAARQYSAVIISASWDTYALRDTPLMLDELEATVRGLTGAGTYVIVLGQVSRIGNFDRNCLWKRLRLPFLDCGARWEAPRGVIDAINEQIAQSARRAGATYFDFNDVICREGQCSAFLDRQLVYYDDGHVSAHGSILLGEALRDDPLAEAVFAPLAQFAPRSSTIAWGELHPFDLAAVLGAAGSQARLLRDDSSGDYVSRRITTTPNRAGLFLAENEGLALRSEIASSHGQRAEILIRIEIGEAADLKQYNIYVDPMTGAVRARGEAFAVLRSNMADDGRISLEALIPPVQAAGSIEMRIFPAATRRAGGGNSREATGVVTVYSLDVARVPAALHAQ
ncbi:acyltransferase family protein [Glycocaulis alkaliphilus]|nr:acyltransferase family protein [Glycocaulis alkaliphilus]